MRRKRSGLYYFFRQYPFVEVLLALLIIAAVLFGGYAIYQKVLLANAQKNYDALTERVFEEVVKPTPDPSKPKSIYYEDKGIDIDDILPLCGNKDDYKKYFYIVPNFDSLLKENPDVIGYLVIPDTVIHYPVMRSYDNDYYLRHNFDNTVGKPGCLYVENFNMPTFDDSLTVIYGHNYETEDMFGTLAEYREPKFREAHPYFYLYLPGEMRIYEVVVTSVYSSDHLLAEDFVYENEDFVFTGMKGNEADSFLTKVKDYAASGYYVSDDADGSEPLLVLSTCFNNTRRFLVAGRCVDVKENGNDTGAPENE